MNQIGTQFLLGGKSLSTGREVSWRFLVNSYLWQHSFVEIDHGIFSISGHSLPSADSSMVVVSFWQKNVHNTVTA